MSVYPAWIKVCMAAGGHKKCEAVKWGILVVWRRLIWAVWLRPAHSFSNQSKVVQSTAIKVSSTGAEWRRICVRSQGCVQAFYSQYEYWLVYNTLVCYFIPFYSSTGSSVTGTLQRIVFLQSLEIEEMIIYKQRTCKSPLYSKVKIENCCVW